MENAELKVKLTTIFRKVFNNPNLILSNELTANDVEKWDSLTHMILISEIEKEFTIQFKLKDLNKMRNVGDMINMIIAKLA